MVEVRPLGTKIGAEVGGIDLGALGDADFARVYDAFLEHVVLLRQAQDEGEAIDLY